MLHTDIPDRAQVGRLLAHRSPSSVSIYVATDPVSPGDAERIDFKNLTAAALQQLRDAVSGPATWRHWKRKRPTLLTTTGSGGTWPAAWPSSPRPAR